MVRQEELGVEKDFLQGFSPIPALCGAEEVWVNGHSTESSLSQQAQMIKICASTEGIEKSEHTSVSSFLMIIAAWITQ